MQYPQPYSYEVYRGDGFSGNVSEAVFPGRQNALHVVDHDVNTEGKVFHYRVVAYDSTREVIDTSAAAWSVRLVLQSQQQRIMLTWQADVPWSNKSASFPYHYIYRGAPGVEDEPLLTLIDSVEVNKNGFTYIDEGQYNGVPLGDQLYCYRIATKGGYGNVRVDDPFVNFSQMMCAKQGDDTPPCQVATPTVVDPPVCDEIECERNVFTNHLVWDRSDVDGCSYDIAFYRIYAATTQGGNYQLLAETTASAYEDENLSSYARCYKISAVDYAGNEGPLSDEVCVDNCPQYRLPNFFTPNGDGCNDVFSAFGPDNNDMG